MQNGILCSQKCLPRQRGLYTEPVSVRYQRTVVPSLSAEPARSFLILEHVCICKLPYWSSISRESLPPCFLQRDGHGGRSSSGRHQGPTMSGPTKLKGAASHAGVLLSFHWQPYPPQRCIINVEDTPTHGGFGIAFTCLVARNWARNRMVFENPSSRDAGFNSVS